MSAWAGIHGRYELEARRKFGLAGGSRNRDLPRLDRLAQYLEDAAVELGQFVEKQHAVMGQGDFAGSRYRTAANQGYRRSRMVRRAEGSAHPVVDAAAESGHRAHRGQFQCFVFGELGQDAGQTAGEHGLAGSRRTDHEQVVRAGCGDFQRAPGQRLAAHFAEVRAVAGGGTALGALGDGQFAASAQVRAHFEQGACAAHVDVADEGGLGGVVTRHDDAATGARRAHHRRQHAVHRAQLAGQCQFAEKFETLQGIARNAAIGGKDAERDRQVETAAVLGQVGWRQTHRDLALRIVELAIEDRRAHAVAGFAHGRLRQTHDGGARQAAGQVHLADHQGCADAVLCTAVDNGEAHGGRTVAGSKCRMRPMTGRPP